MTITCLSKLTFSGVLLWGSAAVAAGSSFPGSSSHGAVIARQVCSACHGIDGNSVISGVPKLAAQYPEYIAKQLHAFRAEDNQKPHRFNETMTPIAEALSDKNIVDIAAYFSKQMPSPGHARQTADLELGERIYAKGNPQTGLPACITCHRADGSGIEPEFPRLAGQRPEYVQAQLEGWQRARGGKGKLMTLIVSFLQAKEIPAVADYVGQLPGGSPHLSGMAAIRANAGRPATPSSQ
jgi:cytochrome c553